MSHAACRKESSCNAHANHPKPPQSAPPSRKSPTSARCRNGTSPISTRAWRRPRSSATSTARMPTAAVLRAIIADGWRNWRSMTDGGQRLAEAIRRYEAIEDSDGSADFLCRPRLCQRHHRPGAHQILWRCAGTDHGGVAASSVLHARAQPHRRCVARSRYGGIRSLATTVPGSRTYARRSPISSRTASRNCSTKRR